MPNLIRTPSMSSVPSIPCLVSPINQSSQGPSSLPTISSLRSSQSFDSSSGLTRLQSSSKTLFLKSSNQSVQMYAFVSLGHGMAHALILILMLRLVSSVALMSVSPFPRSAQSTRSECGQLPHHSPTPPKGDSLCEPHCAAGPQPQLAVYFSQSTLHPQQRGTASAH